jgi:pyruvate dehydrogenase (quinone)
MRVMEGDPKFEASQNIPNFPYARYAEDLGLKGIRIDRPEQIGSAWEEVLNADKPAILEAITDPEVPPIPPHITFDQAKGLGYALLKRDPEAADVIKQSAKGVIEEYVPEEYRNRAEDLLRRAQNRFPGRGGDRSE